jgi:hypothetical protein
VIVISPCAVAELSAADEVAASVDAVSAEAVPPPQALRAAQVANRAATDETRENECADFMDDSWISVASTPLPGLCGHGQRVVNQCASSEQTDKVGVTRCVGTAVCTADRGCQALPERRLPQPIRIETSASLASPFSA